MVYVYYNIKYYVNIDTKSRYCYYWSKSGSSLWSGPIPLMRKDK